MTPQHTLVTSGGLPNWAERLTAFAALVVLGPVLLILAVAVCLSSRGPALFRQTRVGKGGRPFEMMKFRSMTTAGSGGPEVTAKGDQRITGLGRWLRATKLDELPELVNILRGEMSFVGPRPEVPGYVDLEDPLWQRVLTARPGLTDPTTLKLRDEETLLQEIAARYDGDADAGYRRVLLPFKLRSSAEYLESRSATSDLRLILQTAWAVIKPPVPLSLADIESGSE